jgi:3-hydroxypropanoate dehydrogenase
MPDRLPQSALDQLFFEARSHNAWLQKAVPDATLRDIVDAMKQAPTSANCQPIRLVFVASQEAKQRLKPHLSAGNLEKTMSAPVTAIVAHDLQFYEHLPRLFPHADAKSWFTSSEAHANTTAFRNGTLQGGYLMMAVRALGLDCGAMSGFDNAGVDRTFFADTTYKSNFLLNIGYGDPKGLFARSPRFGFDEIAKII